MPIDPRTTAFVFPGQGSQFIGMGKALAQAEPAAAQVFARADQLLGFPLSTLCWEGPVETLNDTVNTQPALLVHSIPRLIAHLSTWVPLEPGDVIVSGTPGGVGARREPPVWMKPGDVVEVEVSGVGVLRNTIAKD
jgi:hypothetical protein